MMRKATRTAKAQVGGAGAQARSRRPAPAGDLAIQVGSRIRRLREKVGLSQSQLGKPYFTRAGISAMEMGKSMPSLNTLVHLATKLGVTAQQLVPDEIDPEHPPFPEKMTRKEVQVLHERSVVLSTAKFLRAKGMDVRNVRRGEESKREPDGLLDSKADLGGEKVIGIEVGCVGYYERGTPEAAAQNRATWNIATGDYDERDATVVPVMSEEDLNDPEKALAKLDAVPPMINFDAIHGYAQAILDQKNGKGYSVPTILIIDADMTHVALTPADEGLRIVSQITVPDPCSFERVYLRMRQNGSQEYEFFPIHMAKVRL